MKQFFVALFSSLGVVAIFTLTLPWMIEYMQVYFNWVGAHFN